MKKISILAVIMMIVLCMTACGKGDKEAVKLDPAHTVSIVIWHYYNGAQQVAFDELVKEFNETVGIEKGIYVEGHSQGDVNQLETTVWAALNKEVGSAEVPNIFSSYADTAYAIDKMGYLSDISQYLTEAEENLYVDSYMEEGRIGTNGELRIFPIAKSSEIMMLNKTEWDIFTEATGVSLSQLETKEGLAEAAKRYYEWTDSLTTGVPNDGKAFYGRDAMANLFIIGSMQLGTEIFQVDSGNVMLNVDKDVMRNIWDTYYVPYIKGYFGAFGRFRSDDVKTGALVAFTGSTTSSMYFPNNVELGDESYPIDYLVLPDPFFADGQKYAVQQGAGMVVTKTTAEEEYASVIFLKWFTQKENNIEFSCASGYLPVVKEAYSKEALDAVIAGDNLEVADKTYDALLISLESAADTTLYCNKAFNGGSAARKVLEYNLADKAAEDRETVLMYLEQGKTLEEATSEFLNEKAFEMWFDGFNNALNDAILNSK